MKNIKKEIEEKIKRPVVPQYIKNYRRVPIPSYELYEMTGFESVKQINKDVEYGIMYNNTPSILFNFLRFRSESKQRFYRKDLRRNI